MKYTAEGLTVRIRGELDMMMAAALRPVLEQTLQKKAPARLIFNLEQTTFIDSSGLALILGRYRQLQERGGRVLIVGVQPTVRRVLELSGIVGLIPIIAAEEDCLQ